MCLGRGHFYVPRKNNYGPREETNVQTQAESMSMCLGRISLWTQGGDKRQVYGAQAESISMCPRRSSLQTQGGDTCMGPRQRACLCAQEQQLYGPREETTAQAQVEGISMCLERTSLWAQGVYHCIGLESKYLQGPRRKHLYRPQEIL